MQLWDARTLLRSSSLLMKVVDKYGVIDKKGHYVRNPHFGGLNAVLYLRRPPGSSLCRSA